MTTITMKPFDSFQVKSDPLTFNDKSLITSNKLFSAGGSVRSAEWLSIQQHQRDEREGKQNTDESEETETRQSETTRESSTMIHQLLVAAHSSPGQRHILGSERYEGPNNLQIWIFSSNINQAPEHRSFDVSRVYLIPHNHGCCWDAKWLNLVDFSLPQSVLSLWDEMSERQSRSNGIFSAALGDGNIHLFVLPQLSPDADTLRNIPQSHTSVSHLKLSPFSVLTSEGQYFWKTRWIIRNNVVSLIGASSTGFLILSLLIS